MRKTVSTPSKPRKRSVTNDLKTKKTWKLSPSASKEKAMFARKQAEAVIDKDLRLVRRNTKRFIISEGISPFVR